MSTATSRVRAWSRAKPPYRAQPPLGLFCHLAGEGRQEGLAGFHVTAGDVPAVREGPAAGGAAPGEGPAVRAEDDRRGELAFAGPFDIGLALVAADRGRGAAGLGWIVSGFGACAGAASLPLTVRGRLPRAGLAQACCLGPAAVAVADFAFVPALPGAVARAVVVGLVAWLSGALCGAPAADPHRTGLPRPGQSGGRAPFSLGLAPMGHPLTGAAIGARGPRPAFVAGAAVAAAGAVVGIAAPALRRAELARRPG